VLYVYSLYFSVMTITSVGYGDVTAKPFNQMEQIVATVIMLLTGMVWGYLVGVFCSMATVSPQTRAFREDMTQLNSFMMEHQLPPDMRFRLREYMHQAIYLERADQSQELLGKLSPAMQGELSLIVHEDTIGCVWYLCLPGIEVGLLLELASQLRTSIFSPMEICPWRSRPWRSVHGDLAHGDLSDRIPVHHPYGARALHLPATRPGQHLGRRYPFEQSQPRVEHPSHSPGLHDH
jgi:hypothetical protein